MKNPKIVEGMTEKQKLSLLTDSAALAAPWLDTLGVPRLSVAEYDAIAKETAIPPLEVLASSFDFSLVREIGKRVGEIAAKKGANFIVSPDISVELGADGNGFSEDPFLCGLFGSALLSGFKGAGLSAAASDLSIRDSDLDYTDANLDDSVLRDFFLKPMDIVSSSPDCDAVVSTEAVLSDDDSETGRMQRIFKRIVNPTVPRLVGNASADGTVASINDGAVLCLNGATVAVAAALENYKKMRQGIDDGSVTISDLEKAVKAGSAISEKSVNEAVDNVVNFIFSCYKRRHSAEEPARPDLIEYAYTRSAVLLKNAAALPLVKGQSVATIGPLPKNCGFINHFTELCSKSGVRYVGHAEGYDLDAELGGNLAAEAFKLAQSADVKIVFLNEPEGRTSVSANRIEILNIARKTKGKTVAVCINRSIDLDIDGLCDAIMLASLNGKDSEVALSKLLLGHVSPSGKLAKTIYRDRTSFYNEIIKKDSAGDKIGRYLGYRLYDAAKIEEMYPFGHGLTYSTVKYSKLQLRGKDLSFVLENKGKFAVTENVEIYIGKKNSALAVPVKELKCVVTRALKPHEKAVVAVRLDDFEKMLGVFDRSDGATWLENGEYILYVGRSVFDIRLQTTFALSGKTLAPEGRQTPAIFRSTSNIHSGAYRLNDNRVVSAKNPVFTIFILFTVVTALADIALPLIMYYQPDMKLLSIILLSAINGAWFIVLIVFIVTSVKRRRNAKLRAARTSFDEEQWDLESLSDVLPLTELFADNDSSGGEKRVRAKKTGLQEDYDKSQYIDQTITFDSICGRYVNFLATYGIGITVQRAKAVLSALASSRLVVLRNADKNLLRIFESATGKFFGAGEYFVDTRGYRASYDVFAEYNGIKNAVTYAGKEPHKMTFVTMDGVDMRNIRSYFTPLIAAFTNVMQSFTVEIKNSMGEKMTYVIPPNMWFFMTESSPADIALPSFVTDFGTVIDLKLSAVKSTGRPGVTDGIAYEQYTWMADACRSTFNYDEAHWKKIDKLEEFVNSQTGDYSIGNKKWGRLEKFVSVYCSCDESENVDMADIMREALDYALCINLIHGMAAALIGKHNGDAPSLIDTVDHTLGQDYDNETESALKAYNAEGISR